MLGTDAGKCVSLYRVIFYKWLLLFLLGLHGRLGARGGGRPRFFRHHDLLERLICQHLLQFHQVLYVALIV